MKRLLNKGLGDESATPIVYEQPLNEHTRVCCRLEQFFAIIEQYLAKPEQGSAYHALSAVVNAMVALDRPDLRPKLVKILVRQRELLKHWASQPTVDTVALAELEAAVSAGIEWLHGNQGKLAQALRENEFLDHCRQHFISAGSSCSFDSAPLFFWLQQPSTLQTQDIQRWWQQFQELKSIVDVLLQLIRETCLPESQRSSAGFFQLPLESQVPCHLVRVELPADCQHFPRISGGKHQLNIRFFHLDDTQRVQQVTGETEFSLACCYF